MDNEHHNPLQKDKYGDTALHAAAQGGSLDVLKYFIDERDFFITDLKCSPNIPGRNGYYLLHYAAQGGHLHIVKYLTDE